MSVIIVLITFRHFRFQVPCNVMFAKNLIEMKQHLNHWNEMYSNITAYK